MKLLPFFSALVFGVVVNSCAPIVQELGNAASIPQLTSDVAIMEDGIALPMRQWPAKKPQAILVAVHGFNDYSNAFDTPATWFATQGVTTYAYDQRSFGKTKNRGIWAGGEVMTRDLATFVTLIKQRHRNLPVYVAGVSMGGAVAMRALGKGWLGPADGVVLVAPAVWGWRSMNMFYRVSLWSAAHLAPSTTATGSGLKIWPSDNIEMLRKLGKDPNMIRKTRIDAIYGLVTLMDEAFDSAKRISKPVLYLYGVNDQLVPREPTFKTMTAIKSEKRIVYYKKGWHMLLRDKQAKRVWSDMLVWMRNKKAEFPSGEEITNKLKPRQIITAARADK